MAFSLFGKKQPEKKPDKPAAPRIEARRPVAPTPSAPPPAGADDGMSLDFTNYAPPPAPASQAPQSIAPHSIAPPSVAPAAKGPPSVAAPSVPPAAPAGGGGFSLDFGSLAAAAVAQQAPASRAPEPSKAPEPPKRKAPKKPLDSILCIEVEEGSGVDVPPAIEEAAILYANGQTEESRARAQKALDGEDLGAWKLQMWLMLFDVLQVLGRKSEFEEKALDFVVKLERSPPAWVDAPTAAARQNPNLRTGGLAAISLTGVLGASSAGAFDQLKKAAERQPKLRLDFAKLQGIEPAGCTLLRDALRGFKAAKKDVYLTGESRVVQLLRDAAKAGDPSVDQAVWNLLIDLYQMLGLQNEFEEAAVDYAVTYEVSPPSWETPPPRPKPLELSQPIAVEGAGDSFHVVGEVAGQSDQIFADIAAYAAGANPLTLDFGAAKRIDFVNAGRLLNVLEKQRVAGKELVVRGAGEMIIALFAVMGITKIARIIPRK